MIPQGRRYPGPWGMLALSLVFHLAAFSTIIRLSSAPEYLPAQEQVTYVDLMTAPVASPQSGTPAPAEERASQKPAPPAPVAPPAASMALPAQQAKAKAKQPAAKGKPAPPAPVEDGREFSERMAKLERQAQEKRQSEVLDRLRKRGGAAVGMPGANGTEAGSDYSSYIQSRLKDAFREVMASQSRTPQVLVRIKIGPDGRITNYRVEKSSGDPLFDDAVSRAVTLAGRSFKPPPGGVAFERVFRFKPEGVGLP